MINVQHYRSFDLYGEAVNFCTKYNISLDNIRNSSELLGGNNTSKYSIKLAPEIFEKEWKRHRIPASYRDDTGRWFYS